MKLPDQRTARRDCPGKGPQDRIRAFYETSDYFDRKLSSRRRGPDRFQRYRKRNVLAIYRPSPGEHVLDLGCGLGTFAFAVAPLCRRATGIDFSRKAIRICRMLQAEKSCRNVEFVCADAHRTGLAAGSIDAIICADLFEHLYPGATLLVIDECRRVLRPGGRLVIWTPCRSHLVEVLKNNHIVLRPDPVHVDYETLPGLCRKLRARGFAVRKAYYAESHVPVVRLLERLLMPVLPLVRRRIAVLAQKDAEADRGGWDGCR